MEYSHIIIDDSAVPQACQFCRSEAVPDSQGEWVQCDRCFGWYHIPCAAGYDNRAGHDPNDIWLCQSCTVIREREGSLDAKAIVIPMLKLIKDHGLMFADAGHVLAKAVAKGVKAVIRGSVSNGICKSVWKLSGEQNSAVNVLLACNVKCRLQANGKRVGFVDYSKFLSLSVSPIAEDAKKQYDSYLDRNLGALICRGLAIEDLKFVYESRPYDICETAFLEEAREAAANRLRNFLREQGDKHGGQQWDTHELWKLVRRPLQAIIIGGCHAALLSKAQADMSGRPGSIDLLKRLGDFMPDAFIALAQRPTSTAEHILELGGVTYEARCGICADGVAADTCVDIAAPESHTKGAKAIFYRYRLPVEAVCDVCYETRPLSYFEFKFCTCSARICRCCAFRTTIAAHVEGADLRCTSCRQPLDTDDRNVIKLVADTTAFVEVLRSLNPSVPTGPANVVIPDNDFAFTNDVAYDILERIYDHGPTPADDDIAQREIAADYRRQLQLGDDVDDEEVMRRARQAAVEGNPPNSPPDDNMSLASENLDRAWPNDDELEVANGGNDSPIRSGPVSVAGDDLDGPLFVVPDGDGHDILMDIGTPDLVQDGDLISGNDREPFVAADASPSTHTVNSTSLTRAIRGSGALSASPQGTAGAGDSTSVPLASSGSSSGVGLISNARIGSGIASRDPGGSENQPSQMGSNPYGRTLPGMIFTATNRRNEAFWWEYRLYAREGQVTREGVRYRCRGAGHCTSTCTLRHDRSDFVRYPSAHGPACAPDPHRQEVSLAARHLQAAARADRNVDVISALTLTGGNSYANTRDVRNLRERQAYTMRSSLQLPGLPTGPVGSESHRRQTHENIARYGQTTFTNDLFLRFNEAAEGIAIFAADECLRRWDEVEMFFIDCTFFVTPPGFAQTLTVTGAVGTQFVQLAYALLPDKSEATYRLALRELKRAVEQLNGECTMTACMVDFESGLRNAIGAVFRLQPQDLRGCLFHASKAWFNKIRSLGLGPVYREEAREGQAHSYLNRWLHAVFGLPCLQPAQVGNAWIHLKSCQPADERISAFVLYMDRRFMTATSTWPPSHWAAPAGERHRTNNAAESLHSALKLLIGRRRPNIRIFLNKLKTHHEGVRVKLRSIHIPNSRRSPKEVVRVSIANRYADGQMTFFEYLEGVGRVNTFPKLSRDGDVDISDVPA